MMHKTEQPYECPECSKTYTSKQYMKIHISNVHHSQKPLNCESQKNEPKKVYHVLPKPRKGRWIVKLERIKINRI